MRAASQILHHHIMELDLQCLKSRCHSLFSILIRQRNSFAAEVHSYLDLLGRGNRCFKQNDLDRGFGGLMVQHLYRSEDLFLHESWWSLATNSQSKEKIRFVKLSSRMTSPVKVVFGVLGKPPSSRHVQLKIRWICESSAVTKLAVTCPDSSLREGSLFTQQNESKEYEVKTLHSLAHFRAFMNSSNHFPGPDFFVGHFSCDGSAGNIAAAFLFLAPVPTFWRIIKNRKVEDFSAVPYLTAALNCALWTLYGLPVVNYQVLVVTINGAGCALEIFYVFIYLLFSERKTRTKVLALFIAMASGFILMTGLVVGLVKEEHSRRTILGVLGGALGLAMYSAPLTIMRLVIQTKSVEFMPFLLSLFVFLNSAAWTIYAFAPKIDVYIATPNSIGVVLGTGQLVLYAIYRTSTPRKPFLAPADKLAVESLEKVAPAPISPEAVLAKETALADVI